MQIVALCYMSCGEFENVSLWLSLVEVSKKTQQNTTQKLVFHRDCPEFFFLIKNNLNDLKDTTIKILHIDDLIKIKVLESLPAENVTPVHTQRVGWSHVIGLSLHWLWTVTKVIYSLLMTDGNSLMCSLIVSGVTQPFPFLPPLQLQTVTNRCFDDKNLKLQFQCSIFSVHAWVWKLRWLFMSCVRCGAPRNSLKSQWRISKWTVFFLIWMKGLIEFQFLYLFNQFFNGNTINNLYYLVCKHWTEGLFIHFVWLSNADCAKIIFITSYQPTSIHSAC